MLTVLLSVWEFSMISVHCSKQNQSISSHSARRGTHKFWYHHWSTSLVLVLLHESRNCDWKWDYLILPFHSWFLLFYICTMNNAKLFCFISVDPPPKKPKKPVSCIFALYLKLWRRNLLNKSWNSEIHIVQIIMWVLGLFLFLWLVLQKEKHHFILLRSSFVLKHQSNGSSNYII